MTGHPATENMWCVNLGQIFSITTPLRPIVPKGKMGQYLHLKPFRMQGLIGEGEAFLGGLIGAAMDDSKDWIEHRVQQGVEVVENALENIPNINRGDLEDFLGDSMVRKRKRIGPRSKTLSQSVLDFKTRKAFAATRTIPANQLPPQLPGNVPVRTMAPTSNPLTNSWKMAKRRTTRRKRFTRRKRTYRKKTFSKRRRRTRYRGRRRKTYRRRRRGGGMISRILKALTTPVIAIETDAAKVLANESRCVYATWSLGEISDFASCYTALGLTPDAAKDDNILIRKMIGIYKFTNVTEVPIEFTLYHVVPRDDILDTRGNVIQTIAAGFVNVGCTNGEIDQTLTPFESPLFCRDYKVLRSRKMILQPGQMVTQTLKSKRMRMYSDAENDVAAISYKRGITQLLLIRLQGIPAHDKDTDGNIGTAQARVDTTSMRKYWVSQPIGTTQTNVKQGTLYTSIDAELPTDDIMKDANDT